MKKNLLFAAFTLLMSMVAFSSCNKDCDDDVFYNRVYDYKLFGIVNIDDKKYEIPAETGTLQMYSNEDVEWNYDMIFTGKEGTQCFTAKGSHDNKNPYIAVNRCSRTFTIDGESFNVLLFGQGNFDKYGNVTMNLSINGNGLNSPRKIYNEDVKLVIIRSNK